MRRLNWRGLLHDSLLCLTAGLSIGFFAGLLLFFVALPFRAFSPLQALTLVRSGLLIAVAFCLLVCAGILLYGRRASSLRDDLRWKRHFSVLGLSAAALLFSLGLLAVATLADGILFAVGAL